MFSTLSNELFNVPTNCCKMLKLPFTRVALAAISWVPYKHLWYSYRSRTLFVWSWKRSMACIPTWKACKWFLTTVHKHLCEIRYCFARCRLLLLEPYLQLGLHPLHQLFYQAHVLQLCKSVDSRMLHPLLKICPSSDTEFDMWFILFRPGMPNLLAILFFHEAELLQDLHLDFLVWHCLASLPHPLELHPLQLQLMSTLQCSFFASPCSFIHLQPLKIQSHLQCPRAVALLTALIPLDLVIAWKAWFVVFRCINKDLLYLCTNTWIYSLQ